MPYRTGITTIKNLLNKICRILLFFDIPIRQVTSDEQYVYVVALKQACEDFILNVPNPRPSNEI
jgi:hypothetical protein